MNPDDICPPVTDDRPTVHYTYDYTSGRFFEHVASKHCTAEHPHLVVDRRHNDDAWNYYHRQNRNDTKVKAVRDAGRELQRTIDTHRRYIKNYHSEIKRQKSILAQVEVIANQMESVQ